MYPTRVHHANCQMIKMHDFKNGGVYFNRFCKNNLVGKTKQKNTLGRFTTAK
jgi:hypothetical protein